MRFFDLFFPQFCKSDMLRYGYLGSKLESPLEFEITRVDCICTSHDHVLVKVEINYLLTYWDNKRVIMKGSIKEMLIVHELNSTSSGIWTQEYDWLSCRILPITILSLSKTSLSRYYHYHGSNIMMHHNIITQSFNKVRWFYKIELPVKLLNKMCCSTSLCNYLWSFSLIECKL